MPRRTLIVLLINLLLLAVEASTGQTGPASTAKQVEGYFESVNHNLIDMAKDFPEDKYDFKLKPEMRSFGAVLIHVAAGNVYAAKAGRGEKVNWDELDASQYKTKAEIVALLEKSFSDADTTLKSLPHDSFAKTVEPWLGVTEHSAEHYGLLIAYYRANGIVPPSSRPKK